MIERMINALGMDVDGFIDHVRRGDTRLHGNYQE